MTKHGACWLACSWGPACCRAEHAAQPSRACLGRSCHCGRLHLERSCAPCARLMVPSGPSQLLAPWLHSAVAEAIGCTKSCEALMHLHFAWTAAAGWSVRAFANPACAVSSLEGLGLAPGFCKGTCESPELSLGLRLLTAAVPAPCSQSAHGFSCYQVIWARRRMPPEYLV